MLRMMNATGDPPHHDSNLARNANQPAARLMSFDRDNPPLRRPAPAPANPSTRASVDSRECSARRPTFQRRRWPVFSRPQRLLVRQRGPLPYRPISAKPAETEHSTVPKPRFAADRRFRRIEVSLVSDRSGSSPSPVKTGCQGGFPRPSPGRDSVSQRAPAVSNQRRRVRRMRASDRVRRIVRERPANRTRMSSAR